MATEAMASAAWVVQEQDGAGTSAQVAVQVRPPRSIPKSLRLEKLSASAVRGIVSQNHYLHSMPTAARLCFGVFHEGELAGAVVFTAGARQGHRLLAGGRPEDVVTLARLWLSDALPKNAESRVIGVALRYLRRSTPWKMVLSYADPAAGHRGTIYQATGWLYLGRGCPSAYVDLGDGPLIHPRTVFSRYGSNRIGQLRRTGVPARRRIVGGKHRYAYVLDPSWRWRLGGWLTAYPQPGRESSP